MAAPCGCVRLAYRNRPGGQGRATPPPLGGRAIACGTAPSLSPPPCGALVGRGGGRGVDQDCATRHDPPPRPSPSRNRVYAGFGQLKKAIEIGNSRFRLGGGRRSRRAICDDPPPFRTPSGEGGAG